MSPPGIAEFAQNDSTLMELRDELGQEDRPVSIYQVHPGSWMRVPEEGYRPLTGIEIGCKLAEYVAGLNFTHVELLFGTEGSPNLPPRELTQLLDRLAEKRIGIVEHGLHEDGVTVLREGGLELKWESGWVRDMLAYLGHDPFFRKFHHDLLSAHGHCGGNSVLPLSHDEVTGGRGSLISKMPGDKWQQFANLRLLFAFQWAQPGKKLIFMGSEFGQWSEWNPQASLDWHLAGEGSRHQGLQHLIADLNRLYRNEAALQTDADPNGFEWGDRSEAELSVIDWQRKGGAGEIILAAFNFTPVPRHNHRIGVPRGGLWQEVFNSDARFYSGSEQGNLGGVEASPLGWKQHSHSLTITLPPLGAVFFKGPNGN